MRISNGNCDQSNVILLLLIRNEKQFGDGEGSEMIHKYAMFISQNQKISGYSLKGKQGKASSVITSR